MSPLNAACSQWLEQEYTDMESEFRKWALRRCLAIAAGAQHGSSAQLQNRWVTCSQQWVMLCSRSLTRI